MKLSKRLETIASFVPEGSRVADIGTDHGYIPIRLVQEGKAEYAIAMDVREGPLLRAQAHIRQAGLLSKVEVRISDGLLKLKQNEADCVVIAGMGGELMIHILEEGRHLWEGISSWILSPHSELYKVRRFLGDEEFFIWRETMIKEEGKYYTVMRAGRKENGCHKGEKEITYRYGRGLLESKDPVLKEYLKKEEEKLRQLIKKLSFSESEAGVRRREELEMELAYNKEAQDAMR